MQCHMITYGNSPQLSKLFTGFALLQEAGEVSLSQEWIAHKPFNMSMPQHLRDARLGHLMVVVNGGIKIHYDNHDSHEIDENAAEGVDAYFKRSYSRPRVPDSLRDKVFPLGLNYAIYPR